MSEASEVGELTRGEVRRVACVCVWVCVRAGVTECECERERESEIGCEECVCDSGRKNE